MLGDIDYTLKPEKMRLYLARADMTIISEISEAYSKKRTSSLTELNTLSFSLPYYDEENNQRVRSRNVDLIRERYYVKMTTRSEIEWFIITKITETVDDRGEVKTVECISVPEELNGKTFNGYIEDSKNMRQVVEDILSLTATWSIDTIDPDFEISYRSWEFTNETLLSAIFQVAERYNAIVKWDTQNRKVSFIKPELHGVNRLGEVDYERLVKKIDKESDSTKVVTRLRAEGKEGLTIQRLTPNGSPYIEDFSYWMFPFERDGNKNVLQHSYHMSDSLCHAILDYQELQESYEGQVNTLNTNKTSLQYTKSTKEQELSNLKADLKAIIQLKTALETDGKMFYDKISYSGSSISKSYSISDIEYYAVLVHSDNPYGITLKINNQTSPLANNQWIVTKKLNKGTSNLNISLSGSGNSTIWFQVVVITQSEYTLTGNEITIVEKYSDLNKTLKISEKQEEINIIQDQINDINDQLANIRSILSFTNNFTSPQIEELDRFILEETFTDETIISDEDLLEEAKKRFKEYQTPQLNLKIDLVNFLDIIEEQRLWDKLYLGDKIIVRHDAFNMRIEAKIIEIEYDEENSNISLTIANFKDLSTAEEQWVKYAYNANKKASITYGNIEKWNQAIIDTSEMSKLFEYFWDKTTNQINMAVNQTVYIADNGITVVDHNDPLRFLRITNGVLGVTRSGGLRYETAISADGIIAEMVLGKLILGQRITIGTEDGIWMTEGAKTTITDRCGRIAMKLGLYEENPDLFGMVINRYDADTLCSTNLINKIIANSEDGFKIQQWNGTQFVDKFYADVNGLLFAEDMTAKRLKIISGTDELILDSYTKYMDIGKFENIITDGKLTSIEKLQIKGEKERIMSEYTKLFNQAEAYKTTSRDNTLRIDTTNFTTAYNELMTYLTPLLADMDETSDIDRNEFIQKFKNYYDEATNIINAINDSIKYSSVQFGSYFNNVVIDFENGVMATRSDVKYRSIMNATKGFAIQKNIGTAANPNWVDQFYADLDGVINANSIKIKNSFITDGGIEGAYIILRDGNGGVMKLYPEDGLWAGSENYDDAPLWITPQGKLKLVGRNGAVFIDTDAGYMDMNNLEIRGVGRLSGDTITVNNVISGYGYINRLTVDKLITYGKNENIGQVSDYIHVQDNYFTLKTGTITNRTQVIANGKPLYWTDSSKTTATDQVTAYPMWNLSVSDITKMILFHKGSGEGAYPSMIWGRGDNAIIDPWVGDSGVINTSYQTANVKSARGFIEKPNGSFDFYYFNSGFGRERSLRLMDNGIYILSENEVLDMTSKNTYIKSSDNIKLSLENGNEIEITKGTSNGTISITHSSGASITISPSGVIQILTSQQINFSASSYNFS